MQFILYIILYKDISYVLFYYLLLFNITLFVVFIFVYNKNNKRKFQNFNRDDVFLLCTKLITKFIINSIRRDFNKN